MRKVIALLVIMMMLLFAIPVLAVALAPPFTATMQSLTMDACRGPSEVISTMTQSALTTPISEQSPVLAYMETGWRSPRGGPIIIVAMWTPMDTEPVAFTDDSAMLQANPDQPIVLATGPPSPLRTSRQTMQMTSSNPTSSDLTRSSAYTRSYPMVTDYGRGARTAPIISSGIVFCAIPDTGLHSSRTSGVIAQMKIKSIPSQSRDFRYAHKDSIKSAKSELQYSTKDTKATLCGSAAV